jgi:8-oxo-dGTP diphosphatase
MKLSEKQNLVYCAGGLLWRETARGREVLLIQSDSAGDWKFPKGHIDEGEDWEAAAQREVEEETGYATEIIDFAGFRKYPVKSRMKVVLYWHMRPLGEFVFSANDEIAACEWLTIDEALQRLTFQMDKDFLRQFA